MRLFLRLAALISWLGTLSVVATPPPGYYLVWGDEFNGTSLDPTKWWVWNQPDRSGYTTPDAVTVGGGYLTLHTYTQNGTNYSPIISSDGLFRERYGYTEASVEFNGSPGMFSDFWLQSPDNTGAIVGDPSLTGSEVDVCEHRVTDATDTNNISNQVTVDFHWDGYGSSGKSTSSGLVGSGLSTGFHTYGLLWNHTNYAASIDGVPAWSTNVGLSDRTEFVLFSSEVDSNSFCGIVPPGGYGSFLVSTTSTMVDYVHFYAPTTTVYWTGASSTNWTDAGNWVTNMVPVSNDDVVFSYLTAGNTSITLGQDVTVNSLSIEETPTLGISGNTLTVNGGGIDMLSAISDAGIYSALVVGAAQTWNIAPGITLVVDTTVTGTGSVTLGSLGTVELDGTNNSSGPTIVSNGTLQNLGVINGPVNVTGGTVAGTGTINGPVTVSAGTLTGTGTVTGPVVVNAGGTLAPGSPMGALVISNTLTLQPESATLVYVNKSAGTSAQITGLTSIDFGGTLIVSNQSGVFAPGDSFNIFSAGSYSAAFSQISPATPGAGLVWDTSDLAANGTLRVISTSNVVVAAQLTGMQLTLSWPAINLGWQLQVQTNPPGQGITTNWTTLSVSLTTNLIVSSIDPQAGSVFYRLVSPDFSTAIFRPGDLIVLQVGNGSIASFGTPGVLKDFSPSGGSAYVQVPLPTNGGSSLIFGDSSYDGVMTLSTNGHSIIIPGYNIPLGSYTSDLDTSSTTGGSAVSRGVGSMSANGTFALSATTAQFSGATIRSAVADGSGDFWAGGGNSGIVYLGNNSPATTVSTVASSTRDLGFVNGKLYFTEAGSSIGVMGFSGAPVVSASPALVLNTAGTGTGTASPKGFAFNPALTIAYVADNRTTSDGGGVQRFNWNGSTWVHAYTFGNTLTASQEVEDLTVDFTGPNPVIYATTGESTQNHLLKLTDTGSGATFSSLEYAQSGDAFRGLVFAPVQ